MKFKKAKIPDTYELPDEYFQKYLFLPNIQSSVSMNKWTNGGNEAEIICIKDDDDRWIPYNAL